MSQRLPRITAAELLRALRRAGWKVDHQHGSHVYLRHEEHSGLVTVPVHAGRTLKPKTLASILDQASLDTERLRALL